MTASPGPIVLYVDDHVANLTVFRMAFSDLFSIRTAENGEEALELFAREQVAVLLADQRMPGMTGVALAERVREQWPETVRMIVTAHSDTQAAIDAINRGQVSRYIAKPWREEDLVSAIRDGLEVYGLKSAMRAMRQQMIRNDRLALLGFLAAGIAHDLNSPVASFLAVLEQMDWHLNRLADVAGAQPSMAEPLGEMRALLEDGKNACERIRTLADGVRQQVRQDTRPARLDLKRLVESTARLCRSELAHRVRLSVTCEAAPEIHGDSGQIGQAVMNLLVNAVQAFENVERAEPRVELKVGARDGHSYIQVTDNGPGIPEELRERVFEPFFSTRLDSGGTGLGLAIVHDVVTRHGGRVEVNSQLGEGTTFTLVFPPAA